MKQQVVHIHGGMAFSQYGDFISFIKNCEIRYPYGVRPQRWTNTLASALGEDYEVFLPQMPNSQNAKYEEWKIWFERHFQFWHDGVILIGHSLGAMFLARYLVEQELPFHVKALYLLGSPFERADFGGEDGGDFAFDTSQARKIAERVEQVYILHFTDDPVVPFSHAEQFAAAVPSAQFVRFEDKGHFLGETFPELTQSIHALK